MPQPYKDLKNNIPPATYSSPGLMSAADKNSIQFMPTPELLWSVTSARTPVVAHIGDSICTATATYQGSSMFAHALARLSPSRIRFGENGQRAYKGSLSGVADQTAKTLTLTYDSGTTESAYFESLLQVGKWIIMPTSGMAAGIPQSWDGRYMQVVAFDTTAKTVTLSFEYTPVVSSQNGGVTPQTQATAVTNIPLTMTRTTNRYLIALGGTTSTQILNQQIPVAQMWTEIPDIVFLNGGINDGNYSNTATNMISAMNALKSKGVRIIVFMLMMPTEKAIQVDRWQLHNANNILRNYCMNTDGIFLLDTSPKFLLPTSTAWEPIGGKTGAFYSSVTRDGIHTSNRGAEIAAEYLQGFLSKMAPKRLPRALCQTDVWDQTNNPNGNQIGTAGFMIAGTNGNLNGVNTSGVPQGWNITTFTLDAVDGVTAKAPVPSITTCDYVASTGYQALRLDLTGLKTPASGKIAELRASKYSTTMYANAPEVDAEMVFRIVPAGSTKVISYVNMTLNVTSNLGESVFSYIGGGYGADAKPCDIIDTTNQWIYMYLRRPVKTHPSITGPEIVIQFFAPDLEFLDGYIEIAHVGVYSASTS